MTLKEYKHNWYLENKKRLNEEAHQRYLANRDYYLNKANEYYTNNRQKVLKTVSVYREKNKESARVFKKNWYNKNNVELTDRYVRSRLIAGGWPEEYVTPELMDIKRKELLLLRKLNNTIK